VPQGGPLGRWGNPTRIEKVGQKLCYLRIWTALGNESDSLLSGVRELFHLLLEARCGGVLERVDRVIKEIDVPPRDLCAVVIPVNEGKWRCNEASGMPGRKPNSLDPSKETCVSENRRDRQDGSASHSTALDLGHRRGLSPCNWHGFVPSGSPGGVDLLARWFHQYVVVLLLGAVLPMRPSTIYQASNSILPVLLMDCERLSTLETGDEVCERTKYIRLPGRRCLRILT
jgi:hypothetical protein